MPIVLNSSIPLPNLTIYTSISVLLVSSCFYYAISVTSDPNWKLETNSTLFSNRHGDSSLEEILSLQDEINEKETIMENFNNLQETILAAIKVTNHDEEIDLDALESEMRLSSEQHPMTTQQPKSFGSVALANADRNLKTRFKDVLSFMLQEPLCIWVSHILFINAF